ncbi:starch-binding protein [Carboxylicivirga linearis]|uniref:Starch-binding protein n=1 Tax=Carboxylicivirga linearis TaxID=1628157 RepID=A0ABS5JWS2_9BACT|nr:starch-binding protein [Carboxylicivirga linearis]MBS2099333.1 starch-binding protein [Carboxylicivirga linearis]
MNTIKYIMAFVFLAAIMTSCEDTYERTAGGEIITSNPILNSLSENEFTLEAPEEGDNGDFLFRTTWTRPRISYENGLPVDVQDISYALEAGILSNNFETKVEVKSTDELFIDIYSSTLYNVTASLAGEDFEETQNIEFRIVASYEGGTDSIISNSIPVVVSPVATWQPEELTIRFKQTTGTWAEFAVYAWGAEEAYGGWPGQVLTADAEGWYSFTVPTSRPINLIMNDNGAGQQFDFLVDPTESACYEFDTDNSTFTAVDCPTPPITISWKYVGSDWASSSIYAWGGDPVAETFGAWPGQTVTPDSEGWCTVTVPAGQTVGNVIFNNGTGGDGGQFDLSMSITEDVCLEITSDSYTVVDCN